MSSVPKTPSHGALDAGSEEDPLSEIDDIGALSSPERATALFPGDPEVVLAIPAVLDVERVSQRSEDTDSLGSDGPLIPSPFQIRTREEPEEEEGRGRGKCWHYGAWAAAFLVWVPLQFFIFVQWSPFVENMGKGNNLGRNGVRYSLGLSTSDIWITCNATDAKSEASVCEGMGCPLAPGKGPCLLNRTASKGFIDCHYTCPTSLFLKDPMGLANLTLPNVTHPNGPAKGPFINASLPTCPQFRREVRGIQMASFVIVAVCTASLIALVLWSGKKERKSRVIRSGIYRVVVIVLSATSILLSGRYLVHNDFCGNGSLQTSLIEPIERAYPEGPKFRSVQFIVFVTAGFLVPLCYFMLETAFRLQVIISKHRVAEGDTILTGRLRSGRDDRLVLVSLGGEEDSDIDGL